MRELRGNRLFADSLLAVFASAALAVSLAAGPGPAPSQQAAAFRPPEVVSTTSLTYPVQSIVGDTVVLDVSLDAQGAVEGTRALRGDLPFVSLAASAVRNWKFQGAVADGSPQASHMTAVFMFRPPVSVFQAPPFYPVLYHPRRTGYVPAGLYGADWAPYPVGSVASGSVTLAVKVGRNGDVAGSRVLRGIQGFTRLVSDTVSGWSFRPATLDGTPVDSTVAVTFVFANPVLNPNSSFVR
jgi:Gram-negative bacterial TonB protein C-terminal